MKAVVAAFNQEKALIGAFSVIANLRMELFEALLHTLHAISLSCRTADKWPGLKDVRRPPAGPQIMLPRLSCEDITYTLYVIQHLVIIEVPSFYKDESRGEK